MVEWVVVTIAVRRYPPREAVGKDNSFARMNTACHTQHALEDNDGLHDTESGCQTLVSEISTVAVKDSGAKTEDFGSIFHD